MTDNTPQKTQNIPLFNLMSLASVITSIQHHRDFIHPELARQIQGIKMKPEQADAPLNELDIALLVMGVFAMALQKNCPAQIILSREDWDYIKLKKPNSTDNISSIREIFCLDPSAVNIEFRPKDQG